MPRLKVPSLQHLARNLRDNPSAVKNVLVRLVESPPRFSYGPLFSAVRDMLVFKHPYEQIREGIRRGINRESVRDNLLGVLPLLRDHFEAVNPDFVEGVDRRYYPVGRGLMVPFDPPLIYGAAGRKYFPWFSFWRANPLRQERLSLFVTLVHEVLLQDPDLEDAKFEILDFSCPAPRTSRDLTIIDSRDIPLLSPERKEALLEIFVEGYFLAHSELSDGTRQHRQTDETSDRQENDSIQSDLFRDT